MILLFTILIIELLKRESRILVVNLLTIVFVEKERKQEEKEENPKNNQNKKEEKEENPEKPKNIVKRKVYKHYIL